MVSILYFLLASLLPMQVPSYQSRSIAVQALDSRTGKPLKRKIIHVYFFDAPTQRRGNYVEVKTDSEGKATFQLPLPLPKTVAVFVQFRNWRQCSPFNYDTAQVLQFGVVGKDACADATGAHSSAAPGEIVVFARYITFGERLRGFPV